MLSPGAVWLLLMGTLSMATSWKIMRPSGDSRPRKGIWDGLCKSNPTAVDLLWFPYVSDADSDLQLLLAALEAPSKRSWWFCLPSFSNQLWEYRRIAKKSNYKTFDHFCLNPQAKPPTRTHQWIQESKRIEVTGAWSLAVGFPHDLPWGVQSVPQEVLVFALGKTLSFVLLAGYWTSQTYWTARISAVSGRRVCCQRALPQKLCRKWQSPSGLPSQTASGWTSVVGSIKLVLSKSLGLRRIEACLVDAGKAQVELAVLWRFWGSIRTSKIIDRGEIL